MLPEICNIFSAGDLFTINLGMLYAKKGPEFTQNSKELSPQKLLRKLQKNYPHKNFFLGTMSSVGFFVLDLSKLLELAFWRFFEDLHFKTDCG